MLGFSIADPHSYACRLYRTRAIVTDIFWGYILRRDSILDVDRACMYASVRQCMHAACAWLQCRVASRTFAILASSFVRMRRCAHTPS